MQRTVRTSTLPDELGTPAHTLQTELPEDPHGRSPITQTIWEKRAQPSGGDDEITPTSLDLGVPPVLNTVVAVFVEGLFGGSPTHLVLLSDTLDCSLCMESTYPSFQKSTLTITFYAFILTDIVFSNEC